MAITLPPRRFLSSLFRQKNSGKRISCAIIGLGDYAKNVLIPEILRTGKYDLRYAVSSSESRARAFQSFFHIPHATTQFTDVLHDPAIQLVFISNKDSLHAKTSLQAARAQKHIFLEKPMSLTDKECTALRTAVLQHHVVFTLGLNRRFSPLAQIAKSTLAHRKSPVFIHYRFTQEKTIHPHRTWITEESGRVRHIFGHFIDFSTWVLDSIPVRVHASSLEPAISPPTAHENIAALVTFKDGSILHLTFLTLEHPYERERIEISCEGKALLLTDFRELTFYDYDHRRPVICRSGNKGKFEQLNSFADFLQGKKQAPFVSLTESINATQFCFAVLESIRKGAPVPLHWKNRR